MTVYERAKRAAEAVVAVIGRVPDTAVVLGSGLGGLADKAADAVILPFSSIPGFPDATVPGHVGRLIVGTIADKRVMLVQGRCHRYEGYAMEDVTLYVRMLALLGVRNLILTNAAGAIRDDLAAGDLMLITDHIGLFCDSPLFGANDERFGPRFPAMTGAYDPALQKVALAAAANCGIPLKTGVYAYAKGPMYETPAEVRALRALGADACGMSTVPETVVAVHGGMRVMGLSCLTNKAAGLSETPPTHEEVLATGLAASARFRTLLTEILRLM